MYQAYDSSRQENYINEKYRKQNEERLSSTKEDYDKKHSTKISWVLFSYPQFVTFEYFLPFLIPSICHVLILSLVLDKKKTQKPSICHI